MTKVTPDGSIVMTGRDVSVYRLLMLRSALKMETKGLRVFRGSVSAYSVIKREFGLKGQKQAVLAQYEAKLRDMGVIS